MIESSRLIIISSPSGAGKSTLCRKLLDENKDLRYSISTTTRAPRSSEADGVHYHFVSDERFKAMIAESAFAEWAEVHGRFYGTSHEEIRQSRASGTSLLLDIDIQGAAQIKAAYPDTITVFLLPPSMEELERRIRARGENTEAQIALRLRNATREIEHHAFFTYLVVNDDLEAAYDELRSIFIAEGCRTERRRDLAAALLEEASSR
jgi:guanylate kinase